MGNDEETAPRLVGRFEHTADGVVAAWPGSCATLHFSGTGVSVELSEQGDNRYLVLIDGQRAAGKLAPPKGRSTVRLASKLPEGEHLVSLYKLTESRVGEVTLHGFHLDGDGRALPPLRPRGRSIELIGDSISAGYGNESLCPEDGFSPETQNHFDSYGARAARALDADLTTVAWSGKGVLRNYHYTEDTVTMGALWTRTLPSRPESRWGFQAPAPDLVLINLGTNDFAFSLDVDAFRRAYDALLDDVRRHYPKSPILLLLGPLLSDTAPPGLLALSTLRMVLKQLAQTRSSTDHGPVRLLELGQVTPAEGYGGNFHPSAQTHTRMAEELVTFLRRELGW